MASNVWFAQLTKADFSKMNDNNTFDAIVIGSGIGGGCAAKELFSTIKKLTVIGYVTKEICLKISCLKIKK